MNQHNAEIIGNALYISLLQMGLSSIELENRATVENIKTQERRCFCNDSSHYFIFCFNFSLGCAFRA